METISQINHIESIFRHDSRVTELLDLIKDNKAICIKFDEKCYCIYEICGNALHLTATNHVQKHKFLAVITLGKKLAKKFKKTMLSAECHNPKMLKLWQRYLDVKHIGNNLYVLRVS